MSSSEEDGFEFNEDSFKYNENDAEEAFMDAINNLEVRPRDIEIETEEDIYNIIHTASNLWGSIDQSFVKWTDKNGVSLLGSAARKNFIHIAEFLLSKGADPLFCKPPAENINSKSIHIASTPLMIALQNSHMEIAEMLLSSLEAKNTKIKNLELITAALIEVAAKYSDLTHNPLISRIVKLLMNRAEGINEPFHMASNLNRKYSLLSHIVSLKLFPHLVYRLLEEPDVDTHGEALGVAAHLLDYDMVVMLIEHSKKLKPSDFSEALILACATGGSDAIPVAKLLLKFEASPLYNGPGGSNSVSIATTACDLELLELLLEEGGDPMDGFEFLTGHDSTIEGEKCLKLLLRYLKINALTSDNSWINKPNGDIPIISILAMNYVGAFVKIAIDLGADFELQDQGPYAEFRRPLDWACRKSNISAARALLESGADINALNGSDKWTAFQTSIVFGSIELVKMLLQYKIDINIQSQINNMRSWSALHLAVARENLEIVKLILNQPDVDVNIVRDGKITALMDAVMHTVSGSHQELEDIITELLTHGADPNISNGKNPPLIIAVEERNVKLVRILVESGANVEIKNGSNESPLSIAADNLDDESLKEIMTIMLHSQIEVLSKPDSVRLLINRVQELVTGENNEILAALCVIMLESSETRKIITDFPELWKVERRAPQKVLRFNWCPEMDLDVKPLNTITGPNYHAKRSNSLAENLLLPSASAFSMDGRVVIYPENMLTWAISKKSMASKVLLGSQYGNKKLPVEWRSNLCTNPTTVGTPLRCAIDEESIEAISSIMAVIKDVWNYQYSSKSKQRNNTHLLDKLQHQDFLYLLAAYPTVMVDFLKAATLVPAYSWVAGTTRAPIEGHTILVSLTKERSPCNIWSNYLKRNHLDKEIYSRMAKYLNYFLNPTYDNSTENKIAELDNFVDEFVPEEKKSWFRRVYEFMHYIIIERSHIQMRFMLYNKDFPGDFDVDRSLDACDMVPLFYEISNIESNVDAYLVPVPQFASYNMLFALVRASEKLQNPSLFESPVVAAVVQLHWRMYALRNHFYNLWLYIGLLVAFMALIFVDQAYPEPNITQSIIIYILQACKVGYSIYFIFQEQRQLKHEGSLAKYLRDPWNVLDIPAFVFLLIGVALYTIIPNSPVVDNVNGVTSLLLWFKLLYFMRPFCYFGPMVYMIFQVIFDIKVFLVILLIVMIGFGNAFFVIMGGRNNGISCDSEDDILSELCGDTVGYPGPFNTIFLAIRSAFSYSLGIYDFTDLDQGQFPVLLSIIWGFFMVIVAIILLNLLIAIISESYKNVSPIKIPAWRLEQARIIVNIYAGISQEERQNLNKIMVEYPWLQVLAPKINS